MTSASSTRPLNFANIQGDILVGGLPKITETYFFFQIDDHRVHEFRLQLAKLIPLITTTAQVLDDRKKLAGNKTGAGEEKKLIRMSGVNIAFTQKGLVKMGVKDDIGDKTFKAGMLADAENLGDKGNNTSKPFNPDWNPAFKNDIHGVFLITGDSHETTAEKLAEIKKIFWVENHCASIHQVFKIVGDVRPGKEKGHEHFGFLDGVSQPAVKDVDKNPHPGQETIRQGVILLGREADTPDVPNVTSRPSWALDGSFLVFRLLHQLVPEFNKFLKDNPLPEVPDRRLGSELLGARLVGRWKSGAPIDLTPTKDDPKLGSDPARNDNFRYNNGTPNDNQSQTRCPFAAHTRKTNPRADLEDNPTIPQPATENRRIIRSGIQFGPEVTADEAASNKTHFARGLLFVSYQSNIANGFQFIQHSWANNTGFIFGKKDANNRNITPGFDPIIGQTIGGGIRSMVGTNPTSQSVELSLPTQWVVPKGGEYFFSPSIAALKNTFALAEHHNGSHKEL